MKKMSDEAKTIALMSAYYVALLIAGHFDSLLGAIFATVMLVGILYASWLSERYEKRLRSLRGKFARTAAEYTEHIRGEGEKVKCRTE